MMLYLAVAVAALGVTLMLDHAWRYLAEAIGITVICYPVAEYGLHRYVLHARGLWRTKPTAWLWRRLHYDHHMDPKDMTVLFAHLGMSVPFLMVLSALAAAAIAEVGLFPAMVFATFCAFAYYETMHAASHLGLRTSNKWLSRRCRQHLRHHYLHEMSDFGIGSGAIDRLCGRATAARGRRRLSPTVRNLGYDGELAAHYPWIARSYASKRAARALQSGGGGTPKPVLRPAASAAPTSSEH
jgi:hypothetical protein